MANIYDVKNYLNSLYELLDTVENSGAKPDGLQASLRDVFKVELHSFFMYLSATDGKVAFQEANFMNTLFDMNLTSQGYVKFINENNIYSTDFENKVPLTLQILTEFDKKTQLMAGILGKSIDPATPIFLKFYADAGKAFLSCDGNVDGNEATELQTYLENLMAKIKENLDNTVNQLGGRNNGGDAVIGGKKGGSASTSVARSTSSVKKYGPSVYKVGVDIPAGEYKVYPLGRGYFGICTDANCDQIIRNENFTGQMYINVSNGQFLDLTRCEAVPVAQAPLYDASSGVYGDGEYKVGSEIPPGEYRVIAQGGRGYYAIEVPMANGDRRIVSNDNFQNAAYVSVQRGQILSLTRCTLRV